MNYPVYVDLSGEGRDAVQRLWGGHPFHSSLLSVREKLLIRPLWPHNTDPDLKPILLDHVRFK